MNTRVAFQGGPASTLSHGTGSGALYFFYKPGQVRVPLTFFDHAALNLLIESGIGFWDQEHHQFVMSTEFITKAVISHLFYAFAQVYIDESEAEPVITKVIWKTPWQDGTEAAPSAETTITTEMDAQDGTETEDYLSEYWLTKLKTELSARKYSVQTRQTYVYYNRELCAFCRKAPPDIGTADIKNFLADLNENRRQSSSSMNLAMSAIKFFYQRILGRNIVNEQRRPIQDQRLPPVLAKTEIKSMLATVHNPKHRLLLMLVYSAGLRVSEVVKLRREDIDFERKTLLIRAAKGRKDRYVMLSEVVACTLHEYLAKQEGGGWLFPGRVKGKPLTRRSAQKVFDQTLEKAGVQKDLSIHSLRHSFATHLLESGTDIKYIQKLLGHTSIRTTERYTHVATGKVLSIVSPLDTLDEPENP